MTCPDDPFPDLPAGREELSAAAAVEYDPYRPGVAAEAAEPLADTVRDLPDPTLLDLGTGTGQVVTEHRFPLTRSWTPERVLGHLRTTSFARAELFAGRHAAFEGGALALLDELAAGGSLPEGAVFMVLLARRPGGAR
ncbi:hypothetical protein [Streptomyces cyslabdanicus]|uniref:hypothetical protein n=1 Tax=Streptomyces cyslabdanicus TaxID=1470456 RepID=UPI004044DEE0